MKRIQESYILKDLDKKIVLLVGPRQAGKTWLSKEIAKRFKRTLYLNYDFIPDREMMLAQSWLPDLDLLILDELHKMPEFKNYLKGIYDTKPTGMRILVTGSARLDIYDQVGDSLAGRYFRHRLLPLSLSELRQIAVEPDLNTMLTRGGFPEPFLAESDQEAERWRQQYVNSMLSTDVFDIDTIENIKAFRLVFELLRSKVASPVSYNSLAEDVQISPNTVKKYIQIMQALYMIFIVTPYSNNIARSILKEPKIYFFDTGLVNGDHGTKLENFVACSLLKSIYAQNDYHATNYSLHYLRTKEKIEVDFALVNNEKIAQIIEVKSTDTALHRGLSYFHDKYSLPAIQVVQTVRHEKMYGDIQLLKAQNYLSSQFM
jgi:predicted AAA+ superfamily ATPase